MKEIALPTTDFAENAVVNVSRVFEPKEVKWLWYPYIPFGKVTLLQGDPGDGKSKLMLSIAALLSNGKPLPFTDEEETEPMTIIYQTTFIVSLNTVLQDICKHEVLGGFFMDKSFNLEKLQKSS